MTAHETPKSITVWARATFGHGSLPALVDRTIKELVELRDAPTEKRAEEFADVLICLAPVFYLHFTADQIQEAVDAKMAVNRKRQWALNGDGTGQHIK